MKGILKYILFAGVVLVTAGCSNEDKPLRLPTEEVSGIRIASGEVGYSTRAVDDEPMVSGQCNADKLIVYQYRYQNLGGVAVNPPNPSKMNFVEKYEAEVTPYPNGLGNRSDRWAIQSASLSFGTTRTSAFAFPALAFTEADEEKFLVSYESVTLDKMSLRLKENNTITPEVYFGRVEAEGFSPDVATGIYSEYRTSSTTVTKSLTGTLYRIVSQINVTISNVNAELVEKMTMELSNIPTEIGLYADHRTGLGQNGSDQGFHYPIVAATSTQQTEGPVVVCETTDFSNETAKLSTFLLPSDEGRSLNIHVYFKEPLRDYHEDGTYTEYTDKSYEIRAPKSYYIPVDHADAYFSKDPICVYNVTDNLFYSFSNVRVNLTGDFDNFFPDRVDVDMVIEVCPRYDREHVYGDNMIDYSK